MRHDLNRTSSCLVAGMTVLLFSLAVAAPASTQEKPRAYPLRIYTTQRTDQPPSIDGRLDDPCWEAVEWAGDFVQWEPDEGKPPTHQTAFKILYDENNLYVAYRAYDAEPERIVNRLARRDWFPGDWVEINIDSHHDRRTAYSFTSSVSGTRGDEFISSDGNNWDGNWDPIWELKTRVDDEGWTAETRIPMSQLRFSGEEEQVWGIQVQRRLFREEERSIWQPKSRDEQGWVSRFGELHGIRNVGSKRQMEFLPYSVARAERFRKETGNPFRDGSDAELSLGLDGKIGVTSDITMDLTVNPDFGQVEADPSEVNLSAFETFFNEKRPFFIEGSNILNLQIAPAMAGGGFTRDNLFYSRRIGRPPSHHPDLGEDEHAHVPARSSILGAVKLSGKTRRGLSIGVIESVTARESARIDRFGNERSEAVEPLANYLAGRLQQDFDKGNTRVGGMLTAVNRKIDEEQLNFMHSSAYSGGIDLVHQWNDRSWFAAANGVGSLVQGDEAAILRTQRSSARYYQRPDKDYALLDPARTSLSGHAGSARFGKTGGGDLRFETGAAWRSPGFEINDMGFLRNADQVNQFGWAGYSIRRPFSIFRRYNLNVNQWLNWDFGGTQLSRAANMNTNWAFRNNWSMGGGVTRTSQSISNTQLRGGPSSRWPGETEMEFWVNSDGRRRVILNFGGWRSVADEGSSEVWNTWSDVVFTPSNALRLSLNPSYSRTIKELQYVATRPIGDAQRYLFASIDQKTFALTFRVDYTVTPNLTIQYYGAPFIASGAYSAYKKITDPRAERYRDRFHEFGTGEVLYVDEDGRYSFDDNGDEIFDYSVGNPDFNVRDFNSNLVARWEFDPGSTLYLVWSQARSGFAPDGRFALGDDLDALFGVHPRNVFLVKVSKWLSL